MDVDVDVDDGDVEIDVDVGTLGVRQCCRVTCLNFMPSF